MRVVLLLSFLECFLILAEVNGIIIEGIAGRVDDGLIFISDVIKEMMVDSRDTRILNLKKEKFVVAYSNCLEKLIEKNLIMIEYAHIPEQYKITSSSVDRRISEIVSARFNGDMNKFMMALRENNIVYEEWKKDLEGQLIIELMKTINVSRFIVIPDGKIKEEYEKNRDKYITPSLVKISIITLPDNEEGRRKAEEILSRLRSGEDFSALARQFSVDSYSGGGGVRDWCEIGMLRKEISEVVKQLNLGEVSDIVCGGGNLYLVRLDDKKEGGMRNFCEIWEELFNEVYTRQIKQIYSIWMDDIKSKHFMHRNEIFILDEDK